MDIENKFEDNLRRQKKLIDPRFVLTVKKESKYGNELIYPICERAKLIVKLFDDKKTFTRRHIEILKQLGFIFQHEEIKI
tara:strand:+ start:619 stop:858 length:240 start_codon:yes stop_codon:yes gene_type:complete